MKSGKLVTAVLGAIVKVVVVVVVVFLIYKGATMGYDYGYRIFTEPAMSAGEGRTVQITLKPDMSAMEVGQMMQDKGLCRDAKLFALQYMLSEYRKEVKPGVFELTTAMTAEDMMEVMATDVEETGETEE